MFAVDGAFIDDDITDAEIVDEATAPKHADDAPPAMFSASNPSFEASPVRDLHAGTTDDPPASVDRRDARDDAQTSTPTGETWLASAGDTWLASAARTAASHTPLSHTPLSDTPLSHTPLSDTPLSDTPSSHNVDAVDPAATATLGSIFATPPEPAEDLASRSPFGQHANDPDSSTNERWSTLDPETEAIDAAAERARRRQAAARPPTEPTPTPSYVSPPTSTPPPAYRTSRTAAPEHAAPPTPMIDTAQPPTSAAIADQPITRPPARPPEPDEHGFAGAIQRLSGAANAHATVAFAVAGALLVEGESVLGAVSGVSLGYPTGIVVTTERVLVVLDRRWVPYVEEFRLTNELQVHGRHHQGSATLMLSDRERLATVDHIVDVVVAIEVAATIRSMASGSAF